MDRTDALKNQHEAAYEALLQVDRLCRENGISYFLLAGTVLGAVRHGGFIPWDDDVDVGMTPENLRRFCEACKTKLPEDFVWSHPDTNPAHPRFFGKIVRKGRHCLDVFPVVPTSDDPRARKKQWRQRLLLHTMYLRKVGVPFNFQNLSAKSVLMYFGSLVLSLFWSRENILKKADAVMNRFEHEKTEYYVNICSRYRLEKELIRREWAEDLQPIRFEGGLFPAFADTHAYLSHLYGDYMTLPPEAERTAAHADQFFDFYG